MPKRKPSAPPAPITDRAEALRRTPADLAEILGCSQRKICLRLGIPFRTWEDWSAKKHDPPDWVWLMIQHALGLYEYDE